MLTTRTTTGTSGATRFDRRMYALMNNREGAAFYATAARRRTAVGVHIALTAASIAVWTEMFRSNEVWPACAMLGLVLPWVIATGVINGSTRGLLELRGRMLDERQLAERDKVRALAHRITTWVLVAAAAAVGAAAWFAGLTFDGMVFPVLFGALVTHWLMPLWVAGLRVQDEPADD